MIVFGDRECELDTHEALARMQRALPPARDAERCTALLIEAGVLAQGVLDWGFARRGCDELESPERTCAELTLAAGHLLLLALARVPPSSARWTRRRRELELALEALRAHALPRSLSVREPEGYAFYGVYPELYAAAARELRARREGRVLRVIGIRSIGTSLAGVVAARADDGPAFTLRPTGHPFARRVSIGPRLEAALLQDVGNTLFAIVDEGPGLSGSSFSAVMGWLVAHGVAPAAICFLPSHAGPPGARCTPQFRAQYMQAQRYQRSFETHFESSLSRWFTQASGADPVRRELSGGRWRALLYPSPTHYPRSYVPDERRKYLLELAGAKYLMKFTGLGASAEAWFQRIRALSARGLCPAPRAARHGFTLTPWLDSALPLDLAPAERGALLDVLGRYLEFSARSPAPASLGAGPDQLFALARHNLRELLGAEQARATEPLEELLPALRATHRPAFTDNKLDAYEWLRLPDGRILKTDALEHSRAHDAIGCQDLAWDIAGATLELALGADERELLLARLRDACGLVFSAEKLRFFEIAYLAFRAGHAAMAESQLGAWPDDAQRMALAKRAYLAQLEPRLELHGPKISSSSRSTNGEREGSSPAGSQS